MILGSGRPRPERSDVSKDFKMSDFANDMRCRIVILENESIMSPVGANGSEFSVLCN